MIEGGLARHVRKLAEALARQGVGVDVLTRGVGDEAPAGEGRPRGAARSQRTRWKMRSQRTVHGHFHTCQAGVSSPMEKKMISPRPIRFSNGT